MKPQNIRRVLVYRLGSLGDTLVALPGFHLIRESFPGAHITLLTNIPLNAKAAPVASILEGTGLVDDYFDYPVLLRDPRAIFRLRNRVASRKFDLLVYMTKPRGGPLFSVRDTLFFAACGILRQVGVPYRRSRLVSTPVRGTGLYRPESSRLVGNLERLGRPDLEEDRWWDLHLGVAERERASEILRAVGPSDPIIAVSMGTKADTKDWTEANWASLVRELSRRRPGYAMVGLGADDEADLTERVLAGWAGPKLNLCGRTGPRLSAAILERASLFIGHDSGPMHLAAAVGTPCVAIFSAQNRPGEWYPRGLNHRVLYHKTECFGCGLLVCVEHGKKCILSITVEEALEAVEDRLALVVPSTLSHASKSP